MNCKEIYCNKCRSRQVHKKIGSNSPYEGAGIVRGVVAIGTFGMSETVWRDYYWQCLKCGKVKKKGF